MKIFLLVFLCLFSVSGAFGQTTATEKPAKTGIEEIIISRDDGEGNQGDEADVFSPRDIPIHSRILLDSTKSVIVKMTLTAVDVKGLKAGRKIITVSYKTNGEQDIINFISSPEKTWLPGKYRFDFFVDDKLAANQEIEISKNPETKAEKLDSTKAKPKSLRKN